MNSRATLRWTTRASALCIVGLTAACLAFFVLSIPLPHVDGQLVGSDGIIYGGIGAWLALRASRHVAGERATLIATLLTILAGNSIYYMTIEPSMSHSLSMFAASAFFFVWLGWRDRPTWRSRACLGGIAGLMALIRPQDGLLLALPILDEVLSARSQHQSPTHWLWSTLTMAGTALLAFTPQLVVWKLLNGGFLRSGYSLEVDELVRWSGQGFLECFSGRLSTVKENFGTISYRRRWPLPGSTGRRP